jgi:hypothetical protein
MNPKTPIETDLDGLATAGMERLQELHHEMFPGAPVTLNAGYLRRKIAWHLQAKKEGGLPDSARQYALALARNSALHVRIGDNAERHKKEIPIDRAVTTQVAPDHDARLPLPGSLLIKDYRGKTEVVRVLERGFEYEGRKYGSLSAVAQEITGTKWNGWAFFGLARKEERLAS